MTISTSVIEEGETQQHFRARKKIEGYMQRQGFEISANNRIALDISFFCLPFKSLFGRFSTRLEYVHHYDIVGIKETETRPQKSLLVDVIEIDGFNSRHGQIEPQHQLVKPKKTVLQQQKKDKIATDVFNVTSDIITLCNRDLVFMFEILRVKSELVNKCKNDVELRKYFLEAGRDSNK
jgi:hypothetical protein